MSATPFTNDRRIAGWHQRFEAAQSADEVSEACAAFIASLSAAELAGLPRECLPPAELDAASISEHALALVRYEHASGTLAPPLVRTLTVLFSDASAANARIAARWRRPGWDFGALRR